MDVASIDRQLAIASKMWRQQRVNGAGQDAKRAHLDRIDRLLDQRTEARRHEGSSRSAQLRNSAAIMM